MLNPAVSVPIDVIHFHNNRFTREAWRLGLRPDQRRASQVRPLSIVFTRGQLVKRIVASTDDHRGSLAGGKAAVNDVGLDASCLASRQNSTRVEVKLGMTHVTASIHCHLVEPSPNKPKHGFFDLHVQHMGNERSGGSSGGGAGGGGGELTSNPNLFPSSTLSLQRFLLSLFKGGAVDTEGLCVVPGRHVWSLSIHCSIWNNDGNVIDACHLAILSLLLAHRRPEAILVRSPSSAGGEGEDGEEAVRLMEEWEREPVPLSLLHTPLSCSFILTEDPFSFPSFSETNTSSTGEGAALGGEEGKERLLADPTIEESAAAATSITVVVNREGQVCGVYKGGGASVSVDHIMECIRLATCHTLEEHRNEPEDHLPSPVSGNGGSGTQVENETAKELGGVAGYSWSVLQHAVERLEVERKKSLQTSFQWAKQRTGVAASSSSSPLPHPPSADGEPTTTPSNTHIGSGGEEEKESISGGVNEHPLSGVTEEISRKRARTA